MKLTFDVPIGYNDFSQSEIARLTVKIKKLVDDLNIVLSSISEENLSKSLNEKLNSISDKATQAFEDAKKALDAIDEIKDGVNDVSAVDEIFSEDT